MEFRHLLQQFDGSHYKTLKTHINLLLEQISNEELSIRDITAMCLMMGIEYVGKDNSAWRDAHLSTIKLKPTSWEKIDGDPDCLLTAFKKAQRAVDIMDSDLDLKPTRRLHVHGVLTTHLAIQGIQAKGCANCPLQRPRAF